MSIIILILIACGIWYYVTHSESHKTWRILARHPFAVLSMIEDSPDWCITKRGCTSTEKPVGTRWVGPFYLAIPGEGRIEFYGKSDVYEKQLAGLATFISTGKFHGLDLSEVLKRQVDGDDA